VLLVGGALTAAFWPRPTMVDLGEVTRGPMMTIDEEGRTRVADAYVVSTPVADGLQRVRSSRRSGGARRDGRGAHAAHQPGGARRAHPRAGEAAVQAAEAALRVARADLNAAIANRDLAGPSLTGPSSLQNAASQPAPRWTAPGRTCACGDANVDTAEAAIAMREAEMANARRN
jgi:HlyD family secretion protein